SPRCSWSRASITTATGDSRSRGSPPPPPLPPRGPAPPRVHAARGGVRARGVGTRVGGASRWLRISSFAGLQPAELAKLALVMYLAFWLAAKRELVGARAGPVPFR